MDFLELADLVQRRKPVESTEDDEGHSPTTAGESALMQDLEAGARFIHTDDDEKRASAMAIMGLDMENPDSEFWSEFASDADDSDPDDDDSGSFGERAMKWLLKKVAKEAFLTGVRVLFDAVWGVVRWVAEDIIVGGIRMVGEFLVRSVIIDGMVALATTPVGWGIMAAAGVGALGWWMYQHFFGVNLPKDTGQGQSYLNPEEESGPGPQATGNAPPPEPTAPAPVAQTTPTPAPAAAPAPKPVETKPPEPAPQPKPQPPVAKPAPKAEPKPAPQPTVTKPAPAPEPTKPAQLPVPKAEPKPKEEQTTQPAPQAPAGGAAAGGAPTDLVSFTQALIARHEGNGSKPYKDSKGLWTVGVGHLIGDGHSLPDAWNRTFNKNEIDELFKQDYAKHAPAAQKIPNYDKLNMYGQAAMIDITFNMGVGWFYKFTQFMAAMKVWDLPKAAYALAESKWMSDVKYRAVEDIALLETNITDRAQEADASHAVLVAAQKRHVDTAPASLALNKLPAAPGSPDKTIIRGAFGQPMVLAT